MSEFARQDWSLFRNLSTIGQKAGVPQAKLRRLVIKEIVDNALDACPGHKCHIGKVDDDTFTVADNGPGIPGTPEEIAALYSISRPLTSTKIVRMPTRGALGNGLRVVAGVVLASGGRLHIATNKVQMEIAVHDDGHSTAEHVKAWGGTGTQVTVTFGPSLPRDPATLLWGQWANELLPDLVYTGKSSAWWYDSDSFYELLQAAGQMPIVKLFTRFDGIKPSDLLGKSLDNYFCNDVGRDWSDRLLGLLREINPEQISPQRIGRMAKTMDLMQGYGRKMGTIIVKPGRGAHNAVLPFCVEAIAQPRAKPGEAEPERDNVDAFVNGTPITGDMRINREGKTKVAMFGCGISHYITGVGSRKFDLTLNVTIPYMPITTDGKAPDFERFLGEIMEVTQKSTRKLKAAANKGKDQGTMIVDALPAAIAKASGDGQYRFSLRQLYYAVRPEVMEATDSGTLDYNYFAVVISRYENERGEIPGIYRDPRGVLYTPHSGTTTPIGTISVEQYKRPEWTFSNVLYIEKEGLFEVLKQASFPERYDCALLSSKGFASRATRDLIDMLGEHKEDVRVFAIHDADGPGTVIFEALVGETIARGARTVDVENLGLDPWEGLEMGLQVETFGVRKSKVPAAKYLDGHGAPKFPSDFDEPEESWREWLQTKRVELNAMTSPQFLAWVEQKFEELGVEKVIPPNDVLTKTFTDDLQAKMRQRVIDEILAQVDVDRLTSDRVALVKVPDDLKAIVGDELEKEPAQRWSKPITELVDAALA